VARVSADVGVTAKNMSIGIGAVGLVALTIGLSVTPSVSVQDKSSHFQEVRRFATEEATQGVAVDESHFYAISNRRIGKYDKHTGQRVGGWEGEPTGPIIHLDSGIVLDGLLWLFRVSGGSFRLSWRDGGVQLTCHRLAAAQSDARHGVHRDAAGVVGSRVESRSRRARAMEMWKSRTKREIPTFPQQHHGIDPLRLPSP